MKFVHDCGCDLRHVPHIEKSMTTHTMSRSCELNKSVNIIPEIVQMESLINDTDS